MKLMSIRLRAAAAVSVVALSAPVLAAQNHYVLDDGAANAAIGFGYAQDYCWMQWFDAVGGVDAITSVQAYIPSTTPIGTPITFCVWDDPNDDGDPSDVVLLATVVTTVQYSGANVFIDYPLGAQPLVHGKFFVGAFLTEDGSMSPAALDYGVNPHVAYFSFNSPGAFDPANINNNFPPTHIETIGAGIHGVFMLRATGSGSTPIIYCDAKLNSLGCSPQIGFLGTPSASAGSGFFVQASAVMNRKSGFLVYGTTGGQAARFFGGTLCVQSPLHRTPPQSSGGSAAGSDCTGVYSFDFNARIASGIDPLLVLGATVNAQYYSRDPGFAMPNNIGLTNAIEFTIQP
jgi:hypothetical protein